MSPDSPNASNCRVNILLKDVINEDNRVMHDADKLAREIMDIAFTRNTTVH